MVSWCVLGPVQSHIHLGAGGDGWEFGVTVGMAGGRGAAVAPRDKEEEGGGERGEGGGMRSLLGRAGRQVRAVSDHILAGGEDVGRFLKQPEEKEV